jgi:hypothetical protein
MLTKTLTETLAPFMNILIIHTQTAYSKGRYILNVVCAHEALHSFRIKKIQYFFIQNSF